MIVSVVGNPFEQRMSVAFMFIGTCWTLWWNIQWKRVMGFWVRPPNRRWVQWSFRAFFALCLMGGLERLFQELQARPLAKGDIAPTIGIALIMGTVVSLLSVFGLWILDRRDRKSGVRGE